jgi:hypothetical protein
MTPSPSSSLEEQTVQLTNPLTQEDTTGQDQSSMMTPSSVQLNQQRPPSPSDMQQEQQLPSPQNHSPPKKKRKKMRTARMKPALSNIMTAAVNDDDMLANPDDQQGETQIQKIICHVIHSYYSFLD